MIGVGIIGLGMMGRMHYAAWGGIEGAAVVAVADADPKRASGDLSEGWSNIAGGAEALDMDRIAGTTDYRELIAMDDVDVVDVCVPTPFHAEMAVAALRAGKHCVCEKPLARTLEQARRIVQAAEKAPGFLLPAMCIRFWPQWAWLRRAVERGTYGRVKDAFFRRVGSPPPGWFRDGEMSGGAILDLHLHDSDFVKHTFGMPRAVRSFGYVGLTGCIDHLVTHYLYDGGPMVTAEGSWAPADGFGFQMAYTVNFQKATAEYVMAREEPLVLYQNGRATPQTCEGADGYQNELSYMAECINARERPTLVTAADAAESLEIIDAERRSVETGRDVSL
jgi:predicted dehydrogenase